MRGLKQVLGSTYKLVRGRIFYRCVDWNTAYEIVYSQIYVASFTDAWIETPYHAIMLHVGKVASFTDAWIETEIWIYGPGVYRVASFTDAWIETYSGSDNESDNKSHLLQMRGLKPTWSLQVGGNLCRIFYRCVDWNSPLVAWWENPHVASFTDAWIETFIYIVCEDSMESHLLQMRGLKLFAHPLSGMSKSRIFYRCVDWNWGHRQTKWYPLCRIFYRCVDWNYCCYSYCCYP